MSLRSGGMSARARLTVVLSTALMWIAMAAVVGAAVKEVGPAWPLALGVLAVFVRFFLAPVVLHMYACGAVAFGACLLAGAYSYFGAPGSAALDVLTLQAGLPWGKAMLGLGYGGLGGVFIAAILARALGREADPETEELLERTDGTTFGGLTFQRRTHPVLIVLAIGIVITMVGFIRGWWLG